MLKGELIGNMIPVILIHSGLHDYLNYTIRQASKNNTVVLIGDQSPDLNLENFKFANLNEYSNGFSEFENNYVHLNTTPSPYEIFCYKRWFILKNYMEKNNLDTIFYIDSDVLLFVDVNEEWEKFSQFEMTLLHRTAAISSFITRKAINNFCDMLLKVYSQKNSYPYKKIESHYRVRQSCGLPGGVCDMTLLEFFHYQSDFGGGPGRVGEMMQIINDSTYDHNINAEDQDFEFIGGMKNIKIKDGIPYVFNKKLNKDIKFNSLHFQGHAKPYIKITYGKCN